MLSWLSRKVLWFKRRKPIKMPLTKWHLACFWLAHSVSGIDMILKDDGTIMVVSKPRSNSNTFVDGIVSKSNGGSIRSHLRINTLSDNAKKFEFKTIEDWSEDLAKFVATVITLNDIDPNLDPSERWGIVLISYSDELNIPIKSEVLFPNFKSEEEMFMRMALDGFDINEKADSNA